MLETGWSEKTQKYMKSVFDYIENTQGGIPEEYRSSLDILAVNYETYNQMIDVLRRDGTLMKYDGGSYVNKAWDIAKQCERTICQICKDFGLNTFSRSKIKLQDSGLSVEEILNTLNE